MFLFTSTKWKKTLDENEHFCQVQVTLALSKLQQNCKLNLVQRVHFQHIAMSTSFTAIEYNMITACYIHCTVHIHACTCIVCIAIMQWLIGSHRYLIANSSLSVDLIFMKLCNLVINWHNCILILLYLETIMNIFHGLELKNTIP